jgi:hypothetical protein
MSNNRYHARQAAVALLKMATATSDQDIAARLVDAASNLKEQAGELPPQIAPTAPDMPTEG